MSLWITKCYYCLSSCFFICLRQQIIQQVVSSSWSRQSFETLIPCSQTLVTSVIYLARISDLWCQSSTNTIPIPQIKPGVLTIHIEKSENPVSGQSSSSHHSVWEALENMGCDLRWCNISNYFSLLRWFGYALQRVIESPTTSKSIILRTDL